ncbi:MAG: hypothetical protein ABSH19_04190 [Opitutales bacterium]|jgi:hypothetical protein
MSNPATRPATTFANWALSVAGVLGSLVIVAAVLAVSYYNTRPSEGVNADAVAERTQKLAEVRAKETQLYNNYSWVDQSKGIVRIPVPEAMRLELIKLDEETKGEPAAPARLSLAASPAAFTPLPLPVALVPPPPASAPATPAAAAKP